VRACTKLGPGAAPDCAQGAFHDYWIALRGADDATAPEHVVRSPRRLCARYPHYALACWYRYWIEQAPAPMLLAARDLTRACAGLAGEQRSGCIAGAAKTFDGSPVDQTRLCAGLRGGPDALACLRGVGNQAYAGRRGAEVHLFRACLRFPPGAVRGCAAWFGKTFNVLENGAFLRRGCPRVVASLRSACVAGARTWGAPLVTFS
jgi:hypothetical protein